MRRPSVARRVRLLPVLSALLLLGAAGLRAGEAPERALDAVGGGEFALAVAHGGALRGELALENGQPRYLVEAALYGVQTNGEDAGLIFAMADGVLLDAQSLAPLATFRGPLQCSQQGGLVVATVHPLDGPDPHLVDIGVLQARLLPAGAGALGDGASQPVLWSAQLAGRARLSLALDLEL